MTQDTIIQILSKKIKIVRAEYDYSQDLMADILGISKKTLIQIEKGRTLPSWTVIVALCALFRESDVIQDTLGTDPMDILQVIAHQSYSTPIEDTYRGKMWWKEEEKHGSFRIQQNLVSGHYRILDEHNRRWYSTFDWNEVESKFTELTGSK